MAWQLLNRAYTIGTVDGAGDITPGSAQTGFRDFTSLSSGNTTYIVAVQGSTWSFMTVTKVGAILRPSTTHDSSTGGAITFSTGEPITVFSDLGQSKIVYEDGDGVAQNATSVLKTFSPEILTELKTTPLPSSGKSVALLRNILADDAKGAVYTWDPDETATGDDFNYVVSGLSATGRWVREKPIIEVPNLANDAAAYDGSLYGVSDSLRHKRSDSVVKKVAAVENFHQGNFSTFAEWQALASSKWADGDTFVFRGITEENDLAGQELIFAWDASSTNTDALGVTQLRPTDITGSNPGRAVLTEPSAMSKFTNSDATPSLAGGRFHRCADTVPAAITALDDLVDLQPHWIFPGAQDQVFTNGASLKCPGGVDFTLRTTGSPVMIVSDNGVVSIIGSQIDITKPNNAASAEIAVNSSGAITLTQYSHTIDTYLDAAADDLTDITWWAGVKAGDTAELRAANTARVVTFKSATGAGKIKTFNDNDQALDDTTKVARILWDGTQTQLVSVSSSASAGGGDYVTFTGNAEDTDSAANWTLLKAMFADSANAGKIIYFPDTGSATYSFDIGDEAPLDIGGSGNVAGLKTAPGAEIKIIVPEQSSTRAMFISRGDFFMPAKISIDTMAVAVLEDGTAFYLFKWNAGSPNLDYLDFDGNMTYNGVTGFVGGNENAKPSVIWADNTHVEGLSMRHAKISNYWRWMLKAFQNYDTRRCHVEHCVLRNGTAFLGFNSPGGVSEGHLYNNNHFFGWPTGTITTSGNGEFWGYGISGTRMHNTTISNNVFHGNFKEAIHIEEAGQETIICNNKSGLNFRGSGIGLIENVVGGTDEPHGTEHWFKRMQVYGNVFVSVATTQLVLGDTVYGYSSLGLTSGQSWEGVFGQGLGSLECKVHDNYFEGFYHGIADRHYDYAQQWYFTNEYYNNTVKDCTVGLRPFLATAAWHDNVLIDNTHSCVSLEGGTFGVQKFIFTSWPSSGHKLIEVDPDTSNTEMTISLQGFELMTYLKLPNVSNNSSADIALIDVDDIENWEAPFVMYDLLDIPTTGSEPYNSKVGTWQGVYFNNDVLIGGNTIRPKTAGNAGPISPTLEFSSGTPNTINLTFDTTSVGEATTFAMSINARNSLMTALIPA